MRIVLFNYALSGGVGSFMVTLGAALQAQGCDVHFVFYEKKRDFAIPSKITVHQIDPSLKKTQSIANALKELLQGIGPVDMILSNSSPSNKILSSIGHPAAWHIVHSAETKEHFGPLAALKRRWRKRKYFKLYHKQRLIVVSKGLEKHITSTLGASPKEIHYIPNPFDSQKIKSMAAENEKEIPNEPFIINVGRFDLSSKRQDILLQAYKQSGLPHKLVLIGGGKDRTKIEAMVKDLGLSQKVLIKDFADNPYSWIKRADLFVLSSDFEGFGRVLVESLILGTPVVGTDCETGPREILTSQLSNFLVPPGDVDALAAKIKKALAYYPRIDDFYWARYSQEEVAKQYVELLDKSHLHKNNR